MKKLSTLNKKYLLEELRDTFDVVQRGDIKMYMRTREGFSYNDFSQKCRVVAAPKKGKYSVDDVVWVHHYVMDDAYKSGDRTLLATLEDNIFFKGESPEDCTEPNTVVFKYYRKDEVVDDGLITQSAADDEYRGVVVAGCLPVGTVISYNINMEMELWHQEVQYLLIGISDVIAVDGEPYGDWYEFNDFAKDEFDCGFLLTGQEGLQFTLGVTPTSRQQVVKLKNRNLPLDGKYAVIQGGGETCYVNEVIAVLS